MKQHWEKLSTRIDGLTLRERVIIFVMLALALIVLVHTALLDPLYAKQKTLSQRIREEQSQISSMQAEIRQKALAQQEDPDESNRMRLQQLKQQFAQMQASLQGMQKGLVSPDRMASLLEDILRRNGRLHLMSLKTLPVSGFGELAAEGRAAAAGNAVPNAAQQAAVPVKDQADGTTAGTESIYRHGVEIVVQGGYLDIMDYLAQLETVPWQLFWGKARLEVGEYPKTTLTLTLYTLSLDKKWLNI